MGRGEAMWAPFDPTRFFGGIRGDGLRPHVRPISIPIPHMTHSKTKHDPASPLRTSNHRRVPCPPPPPPLPLPPHRYAAATATAASFFGWAGRSDGRTGRPFVMCVYACACMCVCVGGSVCVCVGKGGKGEVMIMRESVFCV
jgi:hypothetical protein